MATTTTTTTGTTTHHDRGILQRLALPIRIVQAVFAIIVLGLTAYVAHEFNRFSPVGLHSPSENNFLVFVAVWTLLALIYLIVVPLRFAANPRIHHPFAVVALEALTMLFWFAGFIALATYIDDRYYFSRSRTHVAQAAVAATVFGAFEWLLFLATTVFATLAVLRNRKNTVKVDPSVRVQDGV